MSSTGRVSTRKVVPPPLVPLPTCHARAKRVQARLFNELPFPTAYIANCRLCLGTKFGDKSTTIIDEPLITMMKHVFPFPVTNQIGLPMNVCTDCFQSVQVFHKFSNQVLANQKKLQETLASIEYLQCDGIAQEVLETPVSNGRKASSNVIEIMSGSEDEAAENCEQEIYTGLQMEVEEIPTEQGQYPFSSPPQTVSTPVRSVSPVTTTATSRVNSKAKGSLVEDIIFIDCETNDNNTDAEIMSEFIEPSTTRTRHASESKRARAAAKLQTTPDASKRTQPKTVYICSTCNETFDKHYDLMCHQKTHFMKECPLCKQSFKYSVIREHIINDHDLLKETNSHTISLK